MKNSEKRRNLRKKLIAALCMLLVSTTLLATTSYAWLILSTAPEVKGMQTTVGANGGLEIALLSSTDSMKDPSQYITSSEGDSSSLFGNSALTSNITWGNIVDLSDDAYGLNMIKLLPAKLDLDPVDDTKLTQSMLSMPLYGTDGRVSETSNAYTNSSTFNENSMTFATPDGDHYMLGFPLEYGVRGVGLSTNKTARETAYDTGLASGSSYGAAFRQAAITSLNANAAALANIAVMHAEGDDSYSWNEVKALWDVVDAILGKRNDDGTRQNGMIATATEAAKYYLLAAFASKLNTVEYEDDAAFTAAATTEAASFQNDAVIELATKIALLKTAADEAWNALKTLPENGTSYTYGQISPVLNLLFSNMDLWGMSVEELRNMDKNELTQLVMQNNMLLTANIKGGAFSLMADIAGDFSAKANMTVSDLSLSTVYNVKHQAANIALSNCASTIAVGVGKTLSNTGSVVISDTYAYVVDMAFRTNAEDSYLLLQTAASQRFTSSSSESTMGGGSTVTFTSGDGDFTAERMKRLMGKIELVFFVPNNEGGQQIVAKAKLDTANATVDGQTVTANIYLVNDSGAMITDQADAKIMSLPFETAKALSVLVYLNGTDISNMDVATGAMSMTGSLNLQFASSAPLTSMDYTAELGPANDTNTTEYNLTTTVLSDVADAAVAMTGIDDLTATTVSITRKQPITFTVTQNKVDGSYQELSVGYTINKNALTDTDGQLAGSLTASGIEDKGDYRVLTYTIPADQVTGHMGIIVEALKYKVNLNITNAPGVIGTINGAAPKTRYLAGEDVVLSVPAGYKVYVDDAPVIENGGSHTITALSKNTNIRIHAVYALTVNGEDKGFVVQGESKDLGFGGMIEYTVGDGAAKEKSAIVGNLVLPGNELTGPVAVTTIDAVQIIQTASASVTGVETTAKLVRCDRDYTVEANGNGVWYTYGAVNGTVNPANFTKLDGNVITMDKLTGDITIYIAKECTVTFTGTAGSSLDPQTVPEGTTVSIPTELTDVTIKVNGEEFTGTSITVTGDMTVEINSATP